MKLVILFVVLTVCFLGSDAEHSGEKGSTQRNVASPFDEIVVESLLNVKKKSATEGRQTRSSFVPLLVSDYIRQKRQHPQQGGHRRPGAPGGFGPGAQGGFGPGGGFQQPSFGAAAANAQAQGFQSQGPLGGFGASAANTQTQSFQAGPHGITGSAGLSGSQTYKLPSGQTISIAHTGGFSVGPDGRPSVSNGQSIAYS